MNKYLLVISIFIVGSNTLFSQSLPSIQTDRPDQTESPFIIPANHFQMEAGFSSQKESEDVNSYLYPSTLIRYGVNANFELRLITEYAQLNIDDETYSGITPVTLGMKVKLAEEKGIIPTTSFIGHISLPKVASGDFKLDYYSPLFRITMQNTLTDKLSLSYNVGARWTGFSAEPIFLYTLSLGYSITDKIGCYLEIFGFAPQKSKSNHMIDAGFTYLVKNNFQLDISGGYQLTENSPDYYYAAGFSFRLPD